MLRIVLRDPASFVSVRFAHNETSVRLSRLLRLTNTKIQGVKPCIFVFVRREGLEPP